jgi:hypothetical protein
MFSIFLLTIYKQYFFDFVFCCIECKVCFLQAANCWSALPTAVKVSSDCSAQNIIIKYDQGQGQQITYYACNKI